MNTGPRLWCLPPAKVCAVVWGLLIICLLTACASSPPNQLSPQLPPESEAQAAMVDRQMFSPRFPTLEAAPPNLSGPLGNPAAPPLGLGAVFEN